MNNNTDTTAQTAILEVGTEVISLARKTADGASIREDATIIEVFNGGAYYGLDYGPDSVHGPRGYAKRESIEVVA